MAEHGEIEHAQTRVGSNNFVTGTSSSCATQHVLTRPLQRRLAAWTNSVFDMHYAITIAANRACMYTKMAATGIT